MNYSLVTVCVLVSNKEEQDSLRNHLHSLEQSGNNIEFFSDSDECVESLTSTQNQKYLMVLGSERCHLVDILSSLPCIIYIYLTEAHDFEDASHLRGIYFETEQLLVKLKNDIKMIDDNNLNFSISLSTKANTAGKTTKDIQDDRLTFSWTQLILRFILNTPKPTENAYGEMVKECRDIYRGNQSVCQQIDDFEKTYDPNNAILWYTKDSFVYRQVNAAFRTENIVTIWKFRCVIQDIYKRLEFLHEQQTKNSISTSSKIHHLYRGQRMVSNELKQIKDNVGNFIGMNSFLSTSLDESMARCFAGNGEDRPQLESVLFEILIDDRKFESVPIIFASITSESNYQEENEVLLAMGTILRIESLEFEGSIWKICLHAHPFNDAVCQKIATILPRFYWIIASIDNSATLLIASVLLEMGEIEKAEEIYQQTSSYKHPFANAFSRYLASCMTLYRIIWTSRVKEIVKIEEQLFKLKELLLELKQLTSPGDFRALEFIEMQLKYHDLILSFFSSGVEMFDSAEFVKSLTTQTIQKPKFILSTDKMILKDSPIGNPKESADVKRIDDETFELMNFEHMKSLINERLVKNDPRRIFFLRNVAFYATKEKKYEEAIVFLRDALSILVNDDQHAEVYSELAEVYAKQSNWPAALECYESIINMPQLSETPSKVAHAHVKAADIYGNMQDGHNALVHYKRGLQLYCQHKSPHDPRVSVLKIKIGLTFEQLGYMDTAVKTYEEVIELGHSDDVKFAFKRIAEIYISREDFDMAYYYLVEILEITQRKFRSDIDFIMDIHLFLVRIELIRHHFRKAYTYFKELVIMSQNHNSTEEMRGEIQHLQKVFADLLSLARPNNRNSDNYY